jgi:hypothetical protein
MWKLGLRPSNSFLGIFVSNFRYFVIAVYHSERFTCSTSPTFCFGLKRWFMINAKNDGPARKEILSQCKFNLYFFITFFTFVCEDRKANELKEQIFAECERLKRRKLGRSIRYSSIFFKSGSIKR